ncbi:MAG TPA: shikimate kinase AroK [Candidatus Saccharimonadia bacterium]|nr:shikimate kinase AroK [Candidatus Saccharimonadia bacterium]
MNPSSNLVLVGPMGAGKSTIGRRLAERYRLAFHDLDQDIEARTGATVRLIFELEGEDGFRRRETQVLYELLDGHGRLVATGGGSVLAAENRALIRARGFVVYLGASIGQQLKRLERDRKRPLLAAPDRRARLEALALERDPLYREVADLVVAGEDLSVANASRRIADALDQVWLRRAESAA